MYIAPNSELRILKEVPIDNSYSDTLYFPSRTAQENYFIGQTKYVLNGLPNSDGSLLSYVRIEEGVIKFELPIQNILDCNYIMFRNISFGNKWFYAFITSREYINNVTTRITFEIDLIQTWFLFDTMLKQCFVEREHSATDEIGDNLISEPIKPDIYIDEIQEKIEWDNYLPVLFDMNESVAGGVHVWAPTANYATTCSPKAYLPDSSAPSQSFPNGNFSSTFGAKLYSMGGDYDEVVCIIMYPRDLINGTPSSVNTGEIVDIEAVTNTFNIPVPSHLEGYVPKNNKLFTYPYNFIKIDNCNKEIVLKWEEFHNPNHNGKFELYAYPTPTGEILLYPLNYMGTGTDVSNPKYAISCNEIPQIALPVDAYNAWLAQRSTGDLVGVVNKGATGALAGAGVGIKAGGAIGGVIGGIGGALTGLFSGYTSFLQNEQYAQDASDSFRGNAIGSLNTVHGTTGFHIKQCCVRAENARIIDDFFTMYGYACGKVKVPNISARPHWTYTKTNGCKIIGSCSNDDIVKIEELFDRGIRFWINPLEVGDFTLNNAPV